MKILNYIKYLVYIQLIDEVVNDVKSIKKGQAADAKAPMSINGVRGEFYMGWRPLEKEENQTSF